MTAVIEDQTTEAWVTAQTELWKQKNIENSLKDFLRKNPDGNPPKLEPLNFKRKNHE